MVDYTKHVKVIDIKTDDIPAGYEFIQISLGYQLDNSTPSVVKHALHVFIPKKDWKNQYSIGDKYMISLSNTGEIKLTKE